MAQSPGNDASAGAPALVVEHVSLRFGGTIALADVSLSVGQGEFLALLGPNGSGKTSLCNVVSGLYIPTAGSVLKDERNLIGLRPHQVAARGIARTFQGSETFGHLTVFENVMLGRHVLWRGSVVGTMLRSPRFRRERRRHEEGARAALELLDLSSYADRVAAELPYGIRKRMELARAMAMDPDLLVLDEPTSGMSPGEKAEIAVLIARLHVEHGLSILMVEHDIRLVRELASRVVVLNVGSVLAVGSAAEVLADEAVVEAYLGRPVGASS